MRWLAIVALVACTHAPPVHVEAPLPSPAEALARMVAAYRALPAYADRGTVTVDGKLAGTFRTAFERPARLRFEFDDAGDPARAYVIWSEAGRGRSAWYLKPGIVVETRDLAEPLADALGVSSMTSYLVPQLLAPALGAHGLAELAAARVDVQPIDGRACLHVRGTWLDQPLELWIDRDSFLLRRLALRGRTLHFEPRTTVAAAELAPPDPHGARLQAYVAPIWLGISFAASTARVATVFADSPAALAGLQPGDELAAVDAVAVTSAADVRARTAGHRPGDRVVLSIRRGGTAIDLPVALAERPDLDRLAHDQLVGKPAPAFALPGVGGGDVELARLAGHVVVLDFWATWCKPCEAAIPELDRLADAHPNVRIIGISNEERSAIEPYLAAHHITYAIARDDQHASSDYLIDALPTTVIIDKRGIVRELAFGYGDYARLEALITELE